MNSLNEIPIQITTETDQNLLRILDCGLDNIEAGRILSHEDAEREIQRIRQVKKEQRMQK